MAAAKPGWMGWMWDDAGCGMRCDADGYDPDPDGSPIKTSIPSTITLHAAESLSKYACTLFRLGEKGEPGLHRTNTHQL